MEALSFSFAFIKEVTPLKLGEKESAGKFTREGEYQSKKKITTIVDADDKNCLVQLTVVPKFNQGVRQWLYIIAGVLFFGSFFCTSKRKNRK